MSHDESPRFYGLYRGVVVNVLDPKKLGRLTIKVPQVNGTDALDWALPCFPFLTDRPRVATGSDSGGASPGSYRTEKITLRLPRAGDPVWVMFEDGNSSSPVWLGSWLGI